DAPMEARVLQAIVARARAGATVLVVGHREPVLAIGGKVLYMGSMVDACPVAPAAAAAAAGRGAGCAVARQRAGAGRCLGMADHPGLADAPRAGPYGRGGGRARARHLARRARLLPAVGLSRHRAAGRGECSRDLVP